MLRNPASAGSGQSLAVIVEPGMAIFSLYDLEPGLPPITVLDIGAFDAPAFPPRHAGLVAAGHARVIGFEPDPQGCVALTLKYGPPHRFFPLFVGTGAPAKFYRTVRPDTGSLYPPNMPVLRLFNDLAENMTAVGVSDVQTARIDDIEEIGDVDYIAIDVQGSELDVFKGAEKALAAAVVVQTEVMFLELYEGQPLFADIDNHLRQRGLWFHTFIDTASLTMKPLRVGAADVGLNQRLWSDAVYVRSPLQLAALSCDKLRKLAVLSHDVYRSYDLALVCLSAADARDGGTLAQRYLAQLTQL
jgi:protein O-GlcNAc transferase